jgi:hypothetical protein
MRSSYGNVERDDRDDMSHSGSMHGSHRAGRSLASGIHVSAEMPDPRTARITIDIDWENLVSRVAHKVGRKLKGRSNRSNGRSTSSRRTTTRRRARA